jgi:hypothetical protein
MTETLRHVGFLSAVALSASLVGCSATTASGDDVGQSTQDLRALLPEEVLGQIHYGDEVSVDYTSTPRYRAYWFNGSKGDWLDVQVSSSTGAVDAFVVDDQYRSLRRGTRAVLPKNAKYFIAVREDALQPATITVKFALTVVHPGDVTPAPDDAE